MSNIDVQRQLSSFQLFLTRSTTILFCTASLVLTVRWCRDMRAADGVWLALLIGLGWEMAKYWPGAAGLTLIQHPYSISKRIMGGVLLLVASIVMLGSITASMGAIAHATHSADKQALSQSREYKDLQLEVKNIDEEIKGYKATAAKYNKMNDPQSARITLKDIPSKQAERNQKTTRLAELESKAGVDATSSYIDLAVAVINGDNVPTKMRVLWLINATIAIVLDVLSILGLSLWNGTLVSLNASKNENVTRIDFDTIKRRRTADTTEGRPDTGAIQDGANTRYMRAKQMISEGLIAPTYRAVMNATKASQSTATRYFEQMLEEGFLRRAGKGFEKAA